MATPLRVLFAEDSEDDALLLERELRRAGYDLTWERIDTAAAMQAALDRHSWDLVLGDYNMPQFSGTAALALLRERGLDVPFIFVSGTIGEDMAVAAMKAGAHDYVMKTNLKRLAPAVERELREAEERRQRRIAQEAVVDREEALRQSEERFSKAFQASPLGLAIATLADERYLDANQAMLTMLGYARSELIGHTGAELGIWNDPGDRAHVAEHIRAARPLRDFEAFIRAKRGRLRCVLASAERIDLAGEQCVLLLFHDITERKRLEDQFRQAQKMEAIGRLAGGVAHDFNNLLTVIMSYADLLRTDLPVNARGRADVEEICKAAEGAAGLARQLLAFSRRQVLQPQLLDLNLVVTNTERLLRRLIGEDITLGTVLAPEPSPVHADPGQLEQVIMNLGVNARDAMPEGGRLTIETAGVALVPEGPAGDPSHTGPYVVLSVSDTGVGMDEDTRARIFEPFFTTKGPGKGTGLGLATVYGIVEQSGGFIRVSSEVGLGTIFRVYLPAASAAVSPGVALSAPPELLSGTETVLLVEDLASVRAVARQVLERRGYKVLAAADGPGALRLANGYSGPIHLLLTDVVMPQVSGRHLADRLVGLRPAIKVLYMSGHMDDAIVRHGVLESGTSFLQKPFTPDTLARKVREVLDSPGG
jgi:two-component system, cell cycle sensor histidine kinase and response regulator CckA